jgi:hypothetical protein
VVCSLAGGRGSEQRRLGTYLRVAVTGGGWGGKAATWGGAGEGSAASFPRAAARPEVVFLAATPGKTATAAVPAILGGGKGRIRTGKGGEPRRTEREKRERWG